jgi:Protein of unknown function (DUF998)
MSATPAVSRSNVLLCASATANDRSPASHRVENIGVSYSVVTLASVLTIAGSLVFAAIVMWLHVDQRDVDPRTKGISHYAVGNTDVAMTVAFSALAIGVTAATFLSAAAVVATEPGIVMLRLAALGVAIVAAVPVPGPTAAAWRGSAHMLSALLFFVAIAAGAVLVSSGAPLRVARLLVVATAAFLASMAGVPGLFSIRGWLQRMCFTLVVAWLLMVALRR